MSENVIEWLRGDERARVSAPSGSRLKGRIVKLQNKYPDDVLILDENEDGSIYAEIPVRYIKVSAPRKVSEEQKEAARDRLSKYWGDKANG